MLWFVRIALKRPYTFVVLALLILIFGPLAAMRAPTDIFPDIKIPVISAVWTYSGLSPEDMSGRVVYYYERQLSSTVNDIDHIESQSLAGYGIVKIFFQPNVDIRTATAQVTSISQTVLKQMPPGITPPLILNYNASTVPILQLALSSASESEQKLFDFGQNFIRPQLATVPGTAIPSPYGGKVRQIQIDVDQQALQSKHLSAQDVEVALSAQNQIVPVGTQKIGRFEYSVKLNNSPDAFEALNDLPIKSIDGSTIYMRDVASIRDGNPPQTNIVRVNGGRAVLMTILKSGAASTLDIVSQVKKLLPIIGETLPSSVRLNALGDQSVFVKAAVSGVAREAVIAALLTSLMILLFLGSWRSTVIIAVSIPLAILSSIVGLYVIGETLNIMTLGGLALAVGILVDDATVTIENVNWHLEKGKEVHVAIMDGSKQIVGPAFVSLLCICIVFIPMFFLTGVAHFLFVPMAEAVMFAMIASFILSRTLVPTLAVYLLRQHSIGGHPSGELLQMMQPEHISPSRSPNPLVRFQQSFERRFARIRETYYSFLVLAIENRRLFVAGFLALVLTSFALVPALGQDFFPSVDAGQIKMHVRAPIGTRIEETAKIFDQVEQEIRNAIPADELGSIVDNLGLTVSGINQAYNNTGTIGPQDGDILVSLKEVHGPTDRYVSQLRATLPRQFPGTTFSFLPADIISQILNFGAPAPIDIQVMGPDGEANMIYARKLLRDISKVPGVADARIQQANNYPQLQVDVDRTHAERLGITERDVTNSLVVTMAGSGQVAPAFWLNKRNGVSYPIVAQTPEYRNQSLSDLENIPIAGQSAHDQQILGGLATIKRANTAAVISHYAVQPVVDIFATPEHRDLGGVATDIENILQANEKDRPKGATISLRGQVQTMNTAFSGLLFGLLGAVVLIYLLIVVNFQSWSDPFVIITALPAALAGIVWMLFATHTSLSVPALTGAIMCMGVATANSILVVSFARERLLYSGSPIKAALEAGYTRFRPVLMTALAMIIGMAPMALGLGEGGEQNAPLGRAVIGGLIAATFATLSSSRLCLASCTNVTNMLHPKENRVSANDIETPLRRRLPNRMKAKALIVVAAAIGLVAWGIFVRASEKTALANVIHEQSIPTVSAIRPSDPSDTEKLTLPGTLQAYYSASVYARVSGYLKHWSVDIGAPVKAGQILADIETPELDQQLKQSEANLETALANERLTEITTRRWQHLLSTDSVSQQEADEKGGDYEAKKALVAAARADVERLRALESFKRIAAPFDGVITARKTDIGALINAGHDAGHELFTVGDVHKLRLYVNVPQSYANQVHIGMKAQFVVPEHQGKSFSAVLSNSSHAVSEISGTVLVELEIDNADGSLLPGEYGNVSFTLQTNGNAVIVPASALAFRKEGLTVATLTPADRVAYRTIKISRDLGATVEIAAGLTTGDRIIDNPPDDLEDGDQVSVAPVAAHATARIKS